MTMDNPQVKTMKDELEAVVTKKHKRCRTDSKELRNHLDQVHEEDFDDPKDRMGNDEGAV